MNAQLELAIKIIFEIDRSINNKEPSYKILAGQLADKDANDFKMTDKERNDIYNIYRDQIESVSIAHIEYDMGHSKNSII